MHLSLRSFLVLGFLSYVAVGQQMMRPGDAAPDFTMTPLQGRELRLSELRGRVVVVTFWSTRCSICHAERPSLNQMAARLRRQNVEILAISTESEDTIVRYVRNNPVDLTIVPNGFGVVLQYADRDSSGRLDMGYPAFFVIDGDGILRHRSSGWGKAATIEASVTKLLQAR